MKQKIGIISYWDSLINYGQILQGTALQYILKGMGYEVETIKYVLDNREDKKTLPEKVHDWIYDDISISTRIKNRITPKKKIDDKSNLLSLEYFREERKFDSFKSNYLNLSEQEFKTLRELEEYAKSFYAFITGSDQVWHKTGGLERKRIFLLDFLSKDTKRISYAASFGRDDIINKKEVITFKECFKKFDALSVREDSGLKLCKKIGADNALLMPDPAILLSKQDWIQYLSLNVNEANKKTVFCYSLKSKDHRVHQILDYLESKGYQIHYACSDLLKDERANTEPTIEEWLEHIINADIVVTTSFHGTLFSLLMNTPFISVGKPNPLSEGSNRRFYSILKELNLLNRLTNRFDALEIEDIINAQVNWTSVNNKFGELRLKGKKFLETALKN
ncbi:polysaccharide pyruvyl transferase family protein [Flavobacterium sp. ASW18X]|uniref:polysaccharide pyruvyl transferase family protein n=1 Tax=Flavobacterium sp. ASW18X TaxID=2572595 RepID=UPI0010AEE25E|nr:polysaccharide pyruvyl transferase family protein [Flavobacterium sp. ASW18X]TKD65549.1 polysaccharide pyruvyl transferase family protein [Flavobacterium sp. ASW18X]